MKEILKNKKTIIILLITLIIILNIGTTVKAIIDSVIDTNKKASLTITKYEHVNGSKENIELAGVEFTIYEIPNNIENIEQDSQKGL